MEDDTDAKLLKSRMFNKNKIKVVLDADLLIYT